jgi:O-methyltransferase involved in polyketide biosynthesis
MGRDTGRVSPTAHYTAWVWHRNGLSSPALATPSGRALYHLLRPVDLVAERSGGGAGLEAMLLARHVAIDHLLAVAIERGLVGQVLEVAAGLSPRGATFTRRFPGLRFVEADLHAMARRKRRALAGAGLLGRHHRVVALDALAATGPTSLEGVVAKHLDAGAAGIAVVTEGLLSYFDRPAVEALWRRIAAVLAPSGGLYLSDLNLAGDVARVPLALPFRLALAAFTRGRVHLHFEGPREVEEALGAAGFGRVAVHQAGQLVRVVEAAI